MVKQREQTTETGPRLDTVHRPGYQVISLSWLQLGNNYRAVLFALLFVKFSWRRFRAGCFGRWVAKQTGIFFFFFFLPSRLVPSLVLFCPPHCCTRSVGIRLVRSWLSGLLAFCLAFFHERTSSFFVEFFVRKIQENRVTVRFDSLVSSSYDKSTYLRAFSLVKHPAFC